MSLLAWLVVGLLAGAIARWIMPGPDQMGWIGTLVLGIVGSLVGGTLVNLIEGGRFDISAAGLLGSIVGAIIVLWIWRSMRGSSRAV